MKFKTLAILALCLPSIPASADVIDFSGAACSALPDGSGALTACTDSSYFNQSYGDTATANITYADQINSTSLKYWLTGYDTLTDVAWGGVGDGNNQSNNLITIAPLAGFSVTLSSLDLANYNGVTYQSNLQILDTVTNAVLYNSANTIAGTTNFSFNITSNDAIGIRWFDSGYNVGIDNITYSIGAASAVPEPVTLTLFGAGLAGMAALRRRRKNKSS